MLSWDAIYPWNLDTSTEMKQKLCCLAKAQRRGMGVGRFCGYLCSQCDSTWSSSRGVASNSSAKAQEIKLLIKELCSVMSEDEAIYWDLVKEVGKVEYIPWLSLRLLRLNNFAGLWAIRMVQLSESSWPEVIWGGNTDQYVTVWQVGGLRCMGSELDVFYINGMLSRHLLQSLGIC